MSDYGSGDIEWLKDAQGKPILNPAGLRVGMRRGEFVDEVPTDNRANSRPRVQSKEPTVIHRWHNRNEISDKQFAAGVNFQTHFHKAHLEGHYAAMDLQVGPLGLSGGGEIDPVTRARNEVAAALESLPHICRSSIWYVVGCDMSMQDAAWRLKGVPGHAQDRKTLKGVVMAGLSGLVDHYRI